MSLTVEHAPLSTPSWSDQVKSRLTPPMPSSGWRGWVGPLSVTVLAGALRFPRLGQPHALAFDETYYAKDALSLLQFGSERTAVDKANELLLASDQAWDRSDIFNPTASFVVHPPVGKWTIAIGEYIFGATPFGWRFAMAVLGTLSVLMIARITRRLTRSDLIGTLAGLLLALDGLHMVLSRTALLDLTLMFWILAAFGFLLIDRDRTRARLAQRINGPIDSDTFGPGLGIRPWRIAAGVALGLALGTKWSALWYIAAFGLLTVFWDSGLRRMIGVRRAFVAAVVRDALPAFVSLVVIAVTVYVFTWAGWFMNPGGWNRDYAETHPHAFLPDALWSLLYYHQQAWGFHVNLTTPHSYQSTPWAWLFQARPTSFFYEGYDRGVQGCDTDKCSAEVLALGNPIIWWAGLLAIFHQLWRWLGHRDWRSGAVLAGFFAGWAPWLLFGDRTIFAFYAIVYLPFLVMALSMSLGALLGPADAGDRRKWGAAAVGALVLAVVAAAWWFMPIWTGETIPYDSWQNRMWFPTWI